MIEEIKEEATAFNDQVPSDVEPAVNEDEAEQASTEVIGGIYPKEDAVAENIDFSLISLASHVQWAEHALGTLARKAKESVMAQNLNMEIDEIELFVSRTITSLREKLS